jgi:hypothetical protein
MSSPIEVCPSGDGGKIPDAALVKSPRPLFRRRANYQDASHNGGKYHHGH